MRLKNNKLNKGIRIVQRSSFTDLMKLAINRVFGKKYFRESSFRSLIDEEEFLPKLERSLLYLKNRQNDKSGIGDYLEFGVSHGTSMRCMYQTLKKLNLDDVRLFGFDSFEGLPDDAMQEDDGVWKPGEYYANIENVKKYLTHAGIDWDRVKLVKGWFSDTLEKSFIEENKIKKAGIVMIDCDLYSAAKEALDFCAPLILDETIFIFDDWNSSDLANKNLGEKKAFDEFLTENPKFESSDFDSYSFNGKPNGEIKLVSLKS